MIVRSETERGLPRGWHLGIKGSISAHSGSVKSLASRSPSRQYRGRVISVQAIVILSVVADRQNHNRLESLNYLFRSGSKNAYFSYLTRTKMPKDVLETLRIGLLRACDQFFWIAALVLFSSLSGCAQLAKAPAPSVGAVSSSARAKVMISMGRSAQQRGDDRSALSFYQSARAIDPTQSAPLLFEGEIAENQGHFQRAQIFFSSYIALHPSDQTAQIDLGIADLAIGQLKAANGLLWPIAQTTRDTRVLRNEAVTLALLGDQRSALSLQRRVVAIDPTDPVLRANLALLLAAKGNMMGAERRINQALALHNPPRFIKADAIMILALAGKPALAQYFGDQEFGDAITKTLLQRVANVRHANGFAARAAAFGMVTVSATRSPAEPQPRS